MGLVFLGRAGDRPAVIRPPSAGKHGFAGHGQLMSRLSQEMIGSGALTEVQATKALTAENTTIVAGTFAGGATRAVVVEAVLSDLVEQPPPPPHRRGRDDYFEPSP